MRYMFVNLYAMICSMYMIYVMNTYIIIYAYMANSAEGLINVDVHIYTYFLRSICVSIKHMMYQPPSLQVSAA